MILKRFFWCMSLRTGTIIIATIGFMFILLLLIILITTNVKVTPVFVNDPTGIITKLSIAFEMLVLTVVSILLIVGAVKRKKWYLVPWLVASIVTVTGIFMTDIYSTAVMFHDNKIWEGISLIVYGLAVLVISIYFWLIVFSFFQELATNERPRGAYKNRAGNAY